MGWVLLLDGSVWTTVMIVDVGCKAREKYFALVVVYSIMVEQAGDDSEIRW
jgi:hypothetical protein